MEAATRRAVAGLQPGWMVVSRCGFGVPSEPPARVRCALVHPRIGVALLDIIPDRLTPEPAERLRRALDQLEFRAIFGGWPPIVYRRLALGQLSELGIVLAAAFAAEAPLALAGGDAWVGSALRALTAIAPDPDGAPTQVEEPHGPDHPNATHLAPEARVPRRAGGRVGVPAVLCGCLVALALAAVLLLPGKESRVVRTEAVAPPPPILGSVAVPMLPLPGRPLEQPTPVSATTQPRFASDTAPPPAPALPEPTRPAHRSSRSITALPRPRDQNEADERCQSIILKAQLGEEPSHADRAYFRRGCPRR
ncbi:MAG: hypothetical protein JO118_02230 [Acetobacteraceae bacterium]|nr:hypothetical protein [Acetobacteraceae bacterium]